MLCWRLPRSRSDSANVTLDSQSKKENLMPKRQDLRALRNMIAEAKLLIDTSPEMPEGRTARAQELLGDAIALADFLAKQEPAVVLGTKGGKATAKAMKGKDPDYY